MEDDFDARHQAKVILVVTSENNDTDLRTCRSPSRSKGKPSSLHYAWGAREHVVGRFRLQERHGFGVSFDTGRQRYIHPEARSGRAVSSP